MRARLPAKRASPAPAPLPTWTPYRRSLGGKGLLLFLATPGIALIPAVGPFLAIGTAVTSVVALFSFEILVKGACPFCGVGQATVLPAGGPSWSRVRARRTGVVFGHTCGVCRNRMIVRLDDRVALPAPRVVAGYRR